MHRVLKTTLQLRPYKLHTVQKLEVGDPARRLAFAQSFLAQLAVDADYLDRVLWTDEAHFYLSGQVNKRNCQIWSAENPRAILQKPLHDQKLTVWIGFTAEYLIGPYFFVDDRGRAVSVNGDRYLEMLDTFVSFQLNERGVLGTVIFQQDGAPPHIRRDVKEFLLDHFGQERIISRGFDQEWPARSPDLNPCDYFLWGCLKSKVYLEKPRTLDELRHAINRCCRTITPEQLHSAVNNITTRLDLVIAKDGSHIEQWL